ncbi:protein STRICTOSIDINE SYNTHASE-LIKE 10-like [Panicum miliaceum]|uniref:Protein STRICTOSIDINE SYNTHASE-LIKE 10-like n=1 Tax=Panicum miliaceum TaxID=4540 RepID=A0A3L6SFZ9_PANMI|nr:protein STRICTOSIDINE SYNTHASE-LIKE 10-like [Panicum miliaceum]
MKYDPRTDRVTVLQSGITYPNGLAISADRTHLVVALTGPCKLLRYWITGPKAGTSETLADLPGYPDNARPDGRGGFWVALHREKVALPSGPDSHLLAVRVGADGQVLQAMRGPKSVRPTEVVEREGGEIYLGSVELPLDHVESLLVRARNPACTVHVLAPESGIPCSKSSPRRPATTRKHNPHRAQRPAPAVASSRNLPSCVPSSVSGPPNLPVTTLAVDAPMTRGAAPGNSRFPSPGPWPANGWHPRVACGSADGRGFPNTRLRLHAPWASENLVGEGCRQEGHQPRGQGELGEEAKRHYKSSSPLRHSVFLYRTAAAAAPLKPD